MRRPTLLLCTLGLAALAHPAWAFAPTETGAKGIEGARVLRFDATTQARLANAPAWERFAAGEGAGWSARFDQQMGTPHRMWGAPIDIGATDTADQVVAGLLAFVDRHADLLGADSSRVRLRSAEYVDETDTWYVDLDVLAEGARIEGGGITARIRHGGLVMLGADTYPGLDVAGTARLSRDLAQSIAVDHGPAPFAVHRDRSAERVVVPVERDGGLALRPAWRATSRTDAPVGKWEVFVDADTGAVFGSRNEIRYLDGGSVEAVHDLRTVNGQEAISPLPFVRVDSGASIAHADDFGLFTLDAPDFRATLQSPYFRVFNEAGPDAELLFASESARFDDASSTAAERSTYVFLHRIREWGERVAPGRVSERMDAHVNLDETCNAYFDGDVNFFSAGDGCNNTGRIADVVFHEWGHGFHYYSLRSGAFDGSLSEGAADTVSFLQTGDSVIAPHFMSNGGGIRDVAPDRVYPDDYVASEAYVHSNGLIFAGAMWDLWGILQAKHGDAEGTALVETLFAEMLRGGPTVETSYDEILLADDDDGDLSNGTPNQCDLVDAFAKHGLGPLGSGAPVLAYHEPVERAPDGESQTIALDLVETAPECYAFDASAASIHYRVDRGEWLRRGLLGPTGELRGVIPAQEPGSFVEYYVEIEDDEGHAVMSPERGPVAPFTFYAGDVVPVHCDDFEESDGGWTHELLDGRPSEGADDWQWGNPRGVGGDPDHAFSGENVWGNDLGGGQWNGLYQDGKQNRLTSPPLSTGHYEGVFLQYHRWLTVEDGIYDDARILLDDEVVWTNFGNVDTGADHTEDAQWVPHAVNLDGLADRRADVRVAFEMESDEGASFGGWTIDDVCLYAPATPDNRLGINDFVAQGDGDDTITLTWTNPPHRPLEKIVVVRRAADFPRGPRSGQVVFQDDNPRLGEVMTIEDADAGDQAWHYAVYASDGRDWLSWTVDGWNADLASVSGDPEGLVAKGCSTVPGNPAMLGVGLSLLGLLGLRRRKIAG